MGVTAIRRSLPYRGRCHIEVAAIRRLLAYGGRCHIEVAAIRKASGIRILIVLQTGSGVA
ncbi:hypothetical protein BGX38DRAFT_1221294, partial [Terfezia claveryi]